MKQTIIGLSIALMLAGCQELEPRHTPQEIIRGTYCNPGRAIENRVWTEYGSGYTLDTKEFHSGKTSLCCSNAGTTGGQGANQTVTFNQDQPRPLVVAGWAKLSGVSGKPDYHCSVYLDVRLKNGQSLYGKMAAFDRTKTDWQYVELIYTPTSSIVSASVHVFLRELKGTAWFDDIYVGEVIDAQGTRSKNLLLDPGFEGTAEGAATFRDEFFNTLASLGCNAFHFYRGASWETVMNPAGMTPVKQDDRLLDFVNDAHRRGFKVWLTVGEPSPTITDTNSPEFPYYACVNGRWGEASTRAVAYFTQYGFDGIGVVPDEWTWSNGRLKERYAKHKNPEVAKFYEKIPSYCSCNVCRREFQQRYGIELPDITSPWRIPAPTWAKLNEFRYDSTSAWMQRTIAAAKAVNPKVITDTMICVLPVCSDNRIDAGAAWDKIGVDTKLDCLQTDPYIELHNYLGDSTHYYTTETAIHLAAANWQRRSGVTLEVCRLRDFERDKEPAEVYGAALSCLVHGSSEFFWWYLDYMIGKVAYVEPKAPASRLTASYKVMKEMEPFVLDATASGDILMLYSRNSEDIWQWLVRGKQLPKEFGEKPNPTRGFVAQKNALYFLLRRGYPFQMTYIDNPELAKLAAARVVIVPFPFALKESEVTAIEELAKKGKTVILLSELSPFDEMGQALPSSRLARFFGAQSPKRDVDGPVTARIGKGSVVFFGNDFAVKLFETITPVKGSKQKVPLPGFAETQTVALDQALTGALGKPGNAFTKQPVQDVEVAVLNGRHGRLVLAINWDITTAVDTALRQDVTKGFKKATGFSINAEAQVRNLNLPLASGDWRLHLEPQEAILVRLE
ncbi:MAG: hypothetical protein PHI84_08200 [Kiritimatiellae bacterium]|nr:hypothetical protein [Kiritimatiellia bacterium]